MREHCACRSPCRADHPVQAQRAGHASDPACRPYRVLFAVGVKQWSGVSSRRPVSGQPGEALRSAGSARDLPWRWAVGWWQAREWLARRAGVRGV